MDRRPILCAQWPLAPEPVGEFRAALKAALAGGPAIRPRPPGPDPLAELEGRDAPDAVAVVIGTSGSTGVPKGVGLSASALVCSARATHERLGGPGHWLLTLPVHHVAGLQVVLRTLDAGTALELVPARPGFDPAAFAAAVRRLPSGRRYSALVPTQLVSLLAAGGPPLDAAAELDAILIGGAASPPAVLEAARAAGLRPVTTYGMSETAGGCVYDGRPLTGVRAAVVDRTVRLGGPMLAEGYLHRPDLTAAAFADGWFHTRDVGRWDTDGRLEVLGRDDDVVISGGENIAPVLVEQALCSVAAVRAACVVGVPDPRWGQAIVAAVQAAGPVDPDELRAAVRAQVGPAAVPKVIEMVATLPQLPSGKVDRAAVAARFEP